VLIAVPLDAHVPIERRRLACGILSRMRTK
jgi:hypothetical protein